MPKKGIPARGFFWGGGISTKKWIFPIFGSLFKNLLEKLTQTCQCSQVPSEQLLEQLPSTSEQLARATCSSTSRATSRALPSTSEHFRALPSNLLEQLPSTSEQLARATLWALSEHFQATSEHFQATSGPVVRANSGGILVWKGCLWGKHCCWGKKLPEMTKNPSPKRILCNLHGIFGKGFWSSVVLCQGGMAELPWETPATPLRCPPSMHGKLGLFNGLQHHHSQSLLLSLLSQIVTNC